MSDAVLVPLWLALVIGAGAGVSLVSLVLNLVLLVRMRDMRARMIWLEGALGALGFAAPRSSPAPIDFGFRRRATSAAGAP